MNNNIEQCFFQIHISGTHIFLKSIDYFKPVYGSKKTRCQILFKENIGRLFYIVI